MKYPILDPQATGKRIKRIRMEKQLSVTDICDYMGFENPQAVYKWQRGESLPSVDNLFALSRLFETPIDNILCEKEEALASSSIFRKSLAVFFAARGVNYKFNDAV